MNPARSLTATLLSGVLGICKPAGNFPQQSFHGNHGSSIAGPHGEV